VWGWSYGGFVAAMALGREQDIFQCGISVAPVTNWKLYGEFLFFNGENRI
jgi:dipeptidyl aminopeptidase/acylaminoacyl peptidase